MWRMLMNYPCSRGQRYVAAVLDERPVYGGASDIMAIYGDKLSLWASGYGKEWLAYRRKPEGDYA